MDICDISNRKYVNALTQIEEFQIQQRRVQSQIFLLAKYRIFDKIDIM